MGSANRAQRMNHLWAKLFTGDLRHPLSPFRILCSSPEGLLQPSLPLRDFLACQTCSIPEKQNSVTPSCHQGGPSGPPPNDESPGVRETGGGQGHSLWLLGAAPQLGQWRSLHPPQRLCFWLECPRELSFHLSHMSRKLGLWPYHGDFS